VLQSDATHETVVLGRLSASPLRGFAGKAISDGKWVSGEAVEEGPMVWGMHRGSGLVQVGSLAKSVGLNGFGMSLNSGFAMTALAGRICRVWQATGSTMV
jgi:hypothetical protein